MYAALIALCALWGAATGLLLPRAAYRLSVEPDEPRRTECPRGHPLTGPARGWLGPPTCPACALTPVPDAPPRPEPPPPGARQTERRSVAPAGSTHQARSYTPSYAPSRSLVAVSGSACAVLAAAVGPRPELVVWLLLVPVAVLLAAVDRAVHRLPDPLTLPPAVAAAALLGVAALLPGHRGSWPVALLGGLALGGGYLVLFLINPKGLGFGDVKLALSLGCVLGWYGWPVLFVGTFDGFLLGAVYGLGLMLLRGADRKTAIPFGPFMIGGALSGLILGGLTT